MAEYRILNLGRAIPSLKKIKNMTPLGQAVAEKNIVILATELGGVLYLRPKK